MRNDTSKNTFQGNEHISVTNFLDGGDEKRREVLAQAEAVCTCPSCSNEACAGPCVSSCIGSSATCMSDGAASCSILCIGGVSLHSANIADSMETMMHGDTSNTRFSDSVAIPATQALTYTQNAGTGWYNYYAVGE